MLSGCLNNIVVLLTDSSVIVGLTVLSKKCACKRGNKDIISHFIVFFPYFMDISLPATRQLSYIYDDCYLLVP